jgi:hypothetical protein
LIAPLRKRTLDGKKLYTRDPRVASTLGELVRLTREEVLQRCMIRQRSNPDYVPSECLLHLVRARRLDNNDRYFERLYRILMERVVRALPPIISRDGRSASLTAEKIRDKVFGRFAELVAADRGTYSESLDYFEVRFDGGLASLRKDAQEKAWREENRTKSLEFDAETGELSAEIEKAAGSYDPFNSPEISQADYRSRLDAAIGVLPREQIRIVEMLRLGIPIDSHDEGAVTIAKTLGRSEKTIRTHRDKALTALRAAMKREDEQ